MTAPPPLGPQQPARGELRSVRAACTSVPPDHEHTTYGKSEHSLREDAALGPDCYPLHLLNLGAVHVLHGRLHARLGGTSLSGLMSVRGASLRSGTGRSLPRVTAMCAVYAALYAALSAALSAAPHVSPHRPPWRLLRCARASLPNTYSGRCVTWHMKCAECLCGGCPAAADASLWSLLSRRCFLELGPCMCTHWAYARWLRGCSPSKCASLRSLFLSMDGPTGPPTVCR